MENDTEQDLPNKLFGSVAEMIAAGSATSLLISVVFQFSYLLSRGWPQAVTHLALADYVDGSVLAIAAWLPLTISAALFSVVIRVTPLHRLLAHPVVAVVIGLFCVSFGGTVAIKSIYLGWLQNAEKMVLGFSIMVLGICLIYLTATQLHSRKTAMRIGNQNSQRKKKRAKVWGAVGIALLICASSVGVFAGDARRRCPSTILIADKDGGQIAGELVATLQKELLITPIKRSHTLVGIPWETVKSYGTRDCAAQMPDQTEISFSLTKKELDMKSKSNVLDGKTPPTDKQPGSK